MTSATGQGEHPGIGFGIHLFDRRDKHEIDTSLFKQGAIGILRPRICAQVIRVVKLGGVHENADHHRVVLPAGLLDQREVPLVKGPHSGHKPYCFAAGFKRADALAKPRDSSDYFHLRE